MNDLEALKKINDAFGATPRPEHFTDYHHCPECAEHDELLRSRNLETLSRADVGNVGWDSIYSVTYQGFEYWMPALARLVLEPEIEQYDWYLPQLLFHLNDRGAASPQQYNAVTQFLVHIKDTRPALIDKYDVKEELKNTIDLWANNSQRARH